MLDELVLSQKDKLQIRHSTFPVALFAVIWIIFAHDSIYAKHAYAVAIPSVCPSVSLSVCPSHG